MRKIKNKKNSREGRWQEAAWNRGGRVSGMKWLALPINTRCAQCIYVYIRVKRSYIRKKRICNAAKRKIRGGNALLIAQHSRITKKRAKISYI